MFFKLTSRWLLSFFYHHQNLASALDLYLLLPTVRTKLHHSSFILISFYVFSAPFAKNIYLFYFIYSKHICFCPNSIFLLCYFRFTIVHCNAFMSLYVQGLLLYSFYNFTSLDCIGVIRLGLWILLNYFVKKSIFAYLVSSFLYSSAHFAISMKMAQNTN